MHRFGRLALVTVVVAASVGITSGASADDWPWSTDARWHPDSGPNHSFCFSGGDGEPVANLKDKMTDAMNYMASATQAGTAQNIPCDDDQPRTDVVWRGDRAFDGSVEVIGVTQCTAVLTNVCDRFRATVNGPLIREHYPDTISNYQLYRDRQMRKTSCHELGHTLGLFHYTTNDDRYNNGSTALYTGSCQRSGWTGLTGDAWTRTYEDHHINHINGWF